MTEIELPVIEFRKSLIWSIYRSTFIITAIVFFVAIITINDDNNVIGKLFLAVMLTFVITGFLMPKSTSLKGRLRMSKKDFVYSLSGHEIIYPLSEISEITLLYDGYEGRTRNVSMLLHDSGDDNKLSFRFRGLTVTYNIRIKYSYLGLLRRLITEIEREGKTVKVMNDNRERINL